MHPEGKPRIYNRWWHITHLYKIRSKIAGKTSRLILNPIQEVLAKFVDWWNYHLVRTHTANLSITHNSRSQHYGSIYGGRCGLQVLRFTVAFRRISQRISTAPPARTCG